MVELREGQTLAIAGLLQTYNQRRRPSAFPGSATCPSSAPGSAPTPLQTVETELVVLVTPELVAPMEPSEVPESPGDRVIQPNDSEFYFLGPDRRQARAASSAPRFASTTR